MLSSSNSLHILKHFFGLSEFKPGQQEIIDHIIQKHDTLAVMPTGSGKSLCFQIPALIFEGLTLVISPLISLMKDQVDRLRTYKIAAEYLNSSLNYEEIQNIFERLTKKEIKILYVAPERLSQPQFLTMMHRQNISMIAVDEAHCISKWGHDFRASYLKIHEFSSHFKNSVLTAFTATATKEVQKDIIHYLQMNKPKTIIKGFDRPNIRYLTLPISDQDKKFEIKRILETYQVPTLIYCSTIKNTQEVYQYLMSHNIRCAPYHSALHIEYKKQVHDDFQNGVLSCVICTNAFGMGIDKKNIRLIIHHNLPSSIEAYYQESGRAGRDGSNSFSVMLGSYKDVIVQEFLLEKNYPTKEDILLIYHYFSKNPQKTYSINEHWIKENISLDWTSLKFHQVAHILKDLNCFEFDYKRRPQIILDNFKKNQPMNHSLLNTYLKMKKKIMIRQKRKIHQVYDYLQTHECKREFLLNYFGEKSNQIKCDGCSICLNWRN